MSEEESQKFVVTVGCAAITRMVRKHGLECVTVRGVSKLFHPREIPLPRIFVIRSTALGTKSTEVVVRELRKIWPLVDILVWAPRSSADLVLGAMKAGAKDVVLEESPAEVVTRLLNIMAGQKLLPRMPQRSSPLRHDRFGELVSRSGAMADIFEQCHQIGPTEATVLILGETGTGKELLARAIHKQSGRKGRFVAVNCAAVPENLIDSELFGHVRGAFTGATTDKKGLFRYADGGTILLDEIGNMPLNAQYHLLRVLQERKIRPVGAHEEIPIDTRILAATSRPLEEYHETGKFREDLFYRLDVVRFVIPPLRERREDIVFLFSHFARRIASQYKVQFPEMSNQFIDAIERFEWPGNVRQLENVTERMILAHPNQRLTEKRFLKLVAPYHGKKESSATTVHPANGEAQQQGLSAPTPSSHPRDMGGVIPKLDLSKGFYEVMEPITEEFEKRYIELQLQRCKGRIGDTADASGFSRRTLLRKMKRYGINNSYRNASKAPSEP